MIKVERNVIYGKAGGKSSKNTYSCKVSLPVAALDALGVTVDDRSVVLEIEDGKVTIRKVEKK